MLVLTIYLDASVLASLFVSDALSVRAFETLRSIDGSICVSDFARLEFASSVAKRLRMGLLEPGAARDAFAAFDTWTARIATRIETETADMIAAAAIIRRLDTSLRTGDALHAAIADRIGATIATFDRKLADAATALGIATIS